MLELLQAGPMVYFQVTLFTLGDIGVSVKGKSKEKCSSDILKESSIFIFKGMLELFPQPSLLVIICILQVRFFCFFFSE